MHVYQIVKSLPGRGNVTLLLPAAAESLVDLYQCEEFVEASLRQAKFGGEIVCFVGEDFQIIGGARSYSACRKVARHLRLNVPGVPAARGIPDFFDRRSARRKRRGTRLELFAGRSRPLPAAGPPPDERRNEVFRR